LSQETRRVNKQDLADAIVGKTDISKTHAGEVLDALFDTVKSIWPSTRWSKAKRFN
jgi:nucleoid DNA-binding protein